MLYYLSLLSVTLLAAFYLWAKYKQTYWSRRGVRSPPAHWLFGNFRDVLFLRSSPPDLLAKYHHEYVGAPVVGFYVLQKPFLLLREPETIKQILVKDFHLFPNHYFGSEQKRDVVGASGLFSIDNPHWKYLRTKLSAAFSTAKQKRLFGLMLECAEQMRSYLETRLEGSRRVSLEARSLCTKYTTDVISSLTFGVKTNSFAEPEPEFYLRSRDLSSQSLWRTLTLFANFFFPKSVDYLGASLFEQHEDYFRQLFWESMNAREKSGTKRGDIIDLLVELKNEKQQSDEFRFEGDQLLGQSAMFFAAGLETSAITMTFTLMQLAKHPEAQARLRRELREKLRGQELTYERAAELSYLNWVMSETLRLHAPAPLIDRVATMDYKIPGTEIVIEKGTAIYMTLTGLHTDPANHPEPMEYDPERFSEERKALIKPGTYMPFGDGPRACIGMRTGTLQTMVGLITILSEYEVSCDDSFKNEVSKRAIFTALSDGMHLYFNKSPLFD